MMKGIWKYDAERLVLEYYAEDGNLEYEIDLERCSTSAQVLDWVGQVNDKAWATDAVVGTLVRALDDLVDLQDSLCSFGQEQGPVKIRELLRGKSSQDFPVGERE